MTGVVMVVRDRACHDAVMSRLRIEGERLDLIPLPAAAAAVLPGSRAEAAQMIGSILPDAWPLPDLLGVLPIQATARPDQEQFGIWLIVERETNTVVGDIGFHGPPVDGHVEVGFSVIPDRRRRGYAPEAARAIVEWAVSRADVREVVARSAVGNEPSARTLTAAGFARVGERDGLIAWRFTPG
jgi:[ribosomal protein S5]-alanine N-acetyltransferase